MDKPELWITPKKYTGESTVISMRLPKDLVQAVDAVAAETGRTRNEILQTSMEFALDHMKVGGQTKETIDTATQGKVRAFKK